MIFNSRENDCYHRLQSCHEELCTTCEKEIRLILFVERIFRVSIYFWIRWKLYQTKVKIVILVAA